MIIFLAQITSFLPKSTYHGWALNPSGAIRSSPPLGLGWHYPTYRSYGRTQNLYRAHLHIAFQSDEGLLFNVEDFAQQQITITSDIHSKNSLRFKFEAVEFGFAASTQYVLIDEHTIGCRLLLEGLSKHTIHIKIHLMIDYWRNLSASRFWEGDTYAQRNLEKQIVFVGANAEGHVVGVHTNRPVLKVIQGSNLKPKFRTLKRE